ncbi:MAG: LamG-like jellyroll fold domain-containing protein, partial [Nanoarchaeota archaeon]
KTMGVWIQKGNNNHGSFIWSRTLSGDTNRFNFLTYGDLIVIDYRSPTGVLKATISVNTPMSGWRLVFVKRVNNIYYLYKDNALIGQSTDASPDLPTSNALSLAKRVDISLFWTGQLDELVFWDRGLSVDEMSEFWNGGSGVEISSQSSIPLKMFYYRQMGR